MNKLALPKPSCLVTILIGFALFGVSYSVTTPIFEAPDELYHFHFVYYIASTWRLPIQPLTEGTKVGPWAQEGSQPPLAYFLAALVIAPVDTADLPLVSQLNPYAALGEAHNDGSNVNRVIHSSTRERFPWHGSILAIHLARLLSVLYGVFAVYLTWRLARELFPHQPWLADGAAALHAFLPMFIFVSAVVNNDALLIPLCSWALLLMVRLIQSERLNLSGFVYLGLVIGCAALTKASALALLPFAGATALWVAWQTVADSEDPAHSPAKVKKFLRTAGQSLLAWGIPFALVAGWWYGRNLLLYGDLLGWNAFLAIVGQRRYPPNFSQEAFSFLQSYWGIFGWFNVLMPRWLYLLFNSLLVIAALGVVAQLFRVLWLLGLPTGQGRRERLPMARIVAYGLVAGWPGAVLLALLRWTTLTPASQGRLLFPAISVLSIGLVGGLVAWLPEKPVRIGLREVAFYGKRESLSIAFVLLFACVSLVAPVAWIMPAYRLPTPLAQADLAKVAHPLDVNFADHLHLLGYAVEQNVIQPGQAVAFTLYWAGGNPTTTEHAVYLHIVGKAGRIVAQRDALPGRGLLSTTAIEPGSLWQERYQIDLPPTAYAPDQLRILVGVYEVKSGVRLAGEAQIGKIALQPKATAPLLDVHFGEDLRLVKYQLNHLSMTRGDTLNVTLAWQRLQAIKQNYTVSVQIINENWQKAGQIDSTLAPPTTTWQANQLNEDQYALQIDPKTPPGLYDVRLAVYNKDGDDPIQLLPIQWDVNRMPTDSIVLTQVRID